MENKLTAVVLVHNDEEVIARCLRSLVFCNEILIINDFSTDKTSKIISALKSSKDFKRASIREMIRNLNSDYSATRNFALQNAKTDWILFLDSDEEVTADLKMEILLKINSDSGINGYFIKRMDHFLGVWLKYGETGNIKFIRLGRKDKGIWIGNVHEVWTIKGKTESLKNPLLHYPHQNMRGFLNKINSYSTIVARSWLENGRKTNIFDITLTPFFKFLFNYCLKLGFLDGTRGFIMAAMMSYHSFLVRSKVFLRQTQ